MLYNINLSVNGSNILCETVNISQNSEQKPIYNFNNNNSYNSVPTDIKSSISINYFLEPYNEPNYSTLTSLINDTTNPISSTINIGNINITGYLSNYSLSLSPNGIVKAVASFDVYYPLTGNFIEQNSSDSSLYDTTESSGIAHYFSASFYSGSNQIIDNNILQLDYSASINNRPIYGIGNALPKQIYITNLSEIITILSENQYNTQYSGQIIDNLILSLQNLRLNNISSLWDGNTNNFITIPLTGMTLIDVKSDLSVDNIMLFNITFNRYH